MTTRIGAGVHVDPSEIRHSFVNGSPVLTFGPWPTVERVDVFLGDVAGVDAVIAELAALRAEMTAAPVITDSDRDCDALNPDGSGEHCHKGGAHKTHRDSNGDTWTNEPAKQVA